MTVKTSRYIYVIELKLHNNGGKEAATEQILNRQYMEPFKADKRQVIGLDIELDGEGKGLLGWKRVEWMQKKHGFFTQIVVVGLDLGK